MEKIDIFDIFDSLKKGLSQALSDNTLVIRLKANKKNKYFIEGYKAGLRACLRGIEETEKKWKNFQQENNHEY
jgi:hypothetical protein